MKTVKPYFDSDFDEMEQLPRSFTVSFNSVNVGKKAKTRVSMNGIQVAPRAAR